MLFLLSACSQWVGIDTPIRFVQANRSGVLLVDRPTKRYCIESDANLEKPHPRLAWKPLPGTPVGAVALRPEGFAIFCTEPSAGLKIVGKTDRFFPLPAALKAKVQNVGLQAMRASSRNDLVFFLSKGGDSDVTSLSFDGARWQETSPGMSGHFDGNLERWQPIVGAKDAELGRRANWRGQAVALLYRDYPGAVDSFVDIDAEDPEVLACGLEKVPNDNYVIIVDRQGKKHVHLVKNFDLVSGWFTVLLRDGRLLTYDALGLKIRKLR